MNKKILNLAIPSIISNITVPLLGLVDVAITGHMHPADSEAGGGGEYMAAIAVGSMVFNIIYWLHSFLRFGTGGMTAQEYGKANQTPPPTPPRGGEGERLPEANDEKQETTDDADDAEIGIGVRTLLVESQVTCWLLALGLIVLQWPLFELAMWLIAPETSLLPIIRTYFNICIWGTIPSLSLYAFTGWFVGMQNTKLPMVISITQNIVNIGLSCIFVYLFDMKIEGVAMGTLTAQWSGMLMAIGLLRWRYPQIWSKISLKRDLHLEELKRFFSVNRILFYRTLFLVAVNLYFIVAGSKGGAVILAVNSVLMQMFILYTYVMDGFAFAAEALCGRYYGAKDAQNFRLAMKGVWLWGTALTVAYTLAYGFGGEAFLRLLTDDAMIREAANDYLPWAIAIPFCGLAAFVWDGIFVGITNTKGMLWGTFSGATAFFLIYFALSPTIANHALWLAFNAYLLFRGIAQHAIYISEKRIVKS